MAGPDHDSWGRPWLFWTESPKESSSDRIERPTQVRSARACSTHEPLPLLSHPNRLVKHPGLQQQPMMKSELGFRKATRSLEGLQKTEREGSPRCPPFYAERNDFLLYDNNSLSAESNRQVRTLASELFSDFHQPSIAHFTLIDASRINIDFCEGPSD